MVLPDDIQCLLNATATGDNVFQYDKAFARINSKAAPQSETALFLFYKDEPQAQLAGDFLADDESAHGRGDDRDGAKVSNSVGEGGAEAFNDWHALEGQGALEILAAVQAASKNKVTIKQRACFLENLQSFTFRHGNED